MNLLFVVVVVIALVGLMALVGLARSLLRIIAALALGLLLPATLYLLFEVVLASTIGWAIVIPDAVYIIAGALGALSVLLWRR